MTVRYRENEAFQVQVTTPRRVLRYEPYQVRVRTPRVVNSPVVLSYSDPFSAASSWSTAPSSSVSAASPTLAPTEKVTYGAAKPVVEIESTAPSDTQSSPSDNSQYSQQKPEMVDVPQAESTDTKADPKPANGSATSSGQIELLDSGDNG